MSIIKGIKEDSKTYDKDAVDIYAGFSKNRLVVGVQAGPGYRRATVIDSTEFAEAVGELITDGYLTLPGLSYEKPKPPAPPMPTAVGTVIRANKAKNMYMLGSDKRWLYIGDGKTGASGVSTFRAADFGTDWSETSTVIFDPTAVK